VYLFLRQHTHHKIHEDRYAAKAWWLWKDSKSFNQLEARIAHRNHVFCQSKTKWYQFVDDLIYIVPTDK
jgi:hypothetical protein